MKGDVTILIKPHAISSPEIYEKVISNYSNSKIHITYLHPAVLAKISKVFISNYYSTTLAVAKSLKVLTIEYTEYNEEALDISNRGSMRPNMSDYFINKGIQMLENTLKKYQLITNRTYKYEEAEESILDALS